MSTPSDRRSRKRLATRRSISDAATRLFFERGFERVTIDEIAAAADVGRMTVFNHFPRKEDLLFDREPEIREGVRDAVRRREPGAGPIESLRRYAHRLIEQRSPYLWFAAETQSFVETVRESDTLKARARAIRDEIADVVAAALAESAGLAAPDADARLAAALLLATWTTAVILAHGRFRATNDTRAAEAEFLAVVDRGTIGIAAAMAGTPYG